MTVTFHSNISLISDCKIIVTGSESQLLAPNLSYIWPDLVKNRAVVSRFTIILVTDSPLELPFTIFWRRAPEKCSLFKKYLSKLQQMVNTTMAENALISSECDCQNQEVDSRIPWIFMRGSFETQQLELAFAG